jgi:hypothetical protein
MPKTIESIYSYGMAPPLAGMVDQSDYGYDSPVMVPFHCFAEDLEACESLNFKAALLGLERFCLECTFSDFGPLGPAFRGRDRVTTTQISRNDLWFLLSIDSVLPANPILDKSHLGQRLLQFHVECRRNRPVTVSAVSWCAESLDAVGSVLTTLLTHMLGSSSYCYDKTSRS